MALMALILFCQTLWLSEEIGCVTSKGFGVKRHLFDFSQGPWVSATNHSIMFLRDLMRPNEKTT